MSAILLHFEQNPVWLLSVAGVLGLMVGSFLNVVVHRLPIMMERAWREECADIAAQPPRSDLPAPGERYTLAFPRSRCPHCRHPISAWENIPILSYLWLRGRCRGCGAAIALRYPALEAVAGLMAIVVAWHYGVSAQTAAALVFTWALIALAQIDYDTQLLPDAITLPLLWLGLAVNLWGLFVPLESAVIGAMAGYLVLWGVYWGFKLLTGKEGMGQGDFKLLAMIGAWLGWQMLPAVILLSSAVGAVVGVSLIALKAHDRAKPIPFGPYLAAAGWIALIWGRDLTDAYLAWIAPG